LGAPTGAAPISAQMVATPVRTAGASDVPAADPVNELLGRRSGYSREGANRDRDRDPVTPASARASEKWADKLEGWLGHKQDWFRSDHCFDGFISPVSNPFLFEDPRSLTEVRPIFLYQTIPGSNPLFRGGNAEFFGLQARLAITDCWSVVINKLGGVSINPGSDSPLPGDTGFSEFWIGPKFTFLRNQETGTIAAAGVTF